MATLGHCLILIACNDESSTTTAQSESQPPEEVTEGPMLSEVTSATRFSEQAIEPIVFANAGGAPRADGCRIEPTLPENLRIELTKNGDSCQIVGLLSQAGNTQSEYIITVFNRINTQQVMLQLLIIEQRSVLSVPFVIPAATSNMPIDTRPIVISSVNWELAPNSCSFILDGARRLSLDGLNITTQTNSCTIAGTPTPTPTTTTRSYAVSASGSAGGVFQASFELTVEPALDP